MGLTISSPFLNSLNESQYSEPLIINETSPKLTPTNPIHFNYQNLTGSLLILEFDADSQQMTLAICFNNSYNKNATNCAQDQLDIFIWSKEPSSSYNKSQLIHTFEKYCVEDFLLFSDKDQEVCSEKENEVELIADIKLLTDNSTHRFPFIAVKSNKSLGFDLVIDLTEHNNNTELDRAVIVFKKDQVFEKKK
jgi:hypothetical protein